MVIIGLAIFLERWQIKCRIIVYPVHALEEIGLEVSKPNFVNTQCMEVGMH